jgi:hypothetical protein
MTGFLTMNQKISSMHLATFLNLFINICFFKFYQFQINIRKKEIKYYTKVEFYHKMIGTQFPFNYLLFIYIQA